MGLYGKRTSDKYLFGPGCLKMCMTPVCCWAWDRHVVVIKAGRRAISRPRDPLRNP